MFRELVSTTSRIAVSQAFAGRSAAANPTGSAKLIAQTMRTNEPLFMRSSLGTGPATRDATTPGNPPGSGGLGALDGRAPKSIESVRRFIAGGAICVTGKMDGVAWAPDALRKGRRGATRHLAAKLHGRRVRQCCAYS